MNRFRTKKRAKDDLAAGRSSEDAKESPLSLFRKGKKTQQEEAKKEFDLSNALPSNDDFRTSLLMNNLSARFSMLREQDDPNTKIGKASDDSVLYPKRQSRLADFGFGAGAGLSDIAEVESIKDPHQPRRSAASDEPESTNGTSVLNRSRPTEGNVLFGGRQKIYKIPAASGGGMTGRAVYEDDVAVSAFQRWRQSEREKTLQGLNGGASDETEEEGHNRSESPAPMVSNRKRETASTTSSSSFMARNSTAATSITSQPSSATKDGPTPLNVSSSAVTSPIPERNVARTRRLYEQGPSHDLSESQNSVASRIEALMRPRPFGLRTPDLASTSTSPTESTRTILTKTSAPSLRSLSPPAPSRSIGNSDLSLKVQPATKQSNPGGLPPLSPPVSETGEQPMPPTLTKDVGKATTLGILQKPSQPYDESQYVQRQLQLQQGRETPTLRNRAESSGRNTPLSADHETKPVGIGARQVLPSGALPPTPVAETEPSQSTAANPTGPTLPLETHIERPSDEDHPAFRQTQLSTPISVGVKNRRAPSPTGKAEPNSQQPSPEDSPTLGPASGLSGLVRQHLRTESVESSLGGAGFDVSGPVSRFNFDFNAASLPGDSGTVLGPWSSSNRDGLGSHSGAASEAMPAVSDAETQSKRNTLDSRTPDRVSTATEDETDEFAHQLANARRRVREKLTSYVESDSSRAPSPLLLPTELSNMSPQPSSNPLGILKPKSSRGSLIDRSRNVVPGQSKGLKILGIGAATMSTSPQPGKQSFDEKEDEGSNAHPGLRAFRQARRELQRRKELEALARQQASQTSQASDELREQRNGVHSAGKGPRQRTPSRERRPPPVAYRQRAPSDESRYNSPGSTGPSGGRSRSGSETSGGRSNSRPPRLRTNANTELQDQLAAPGSGRPMMRSPGLPGTDIKNSPMMPPYPYPSRGGPSPAPSPHFDGSRSAANLALHAGRPGLDPHSGQPSPISPMGLPSPAPYATEPAGSPASTPTSFGLRPRLPSASQSPALGPANRAMPGPMRRPVDKREISEPTFVMTTSRVPTTALPHHASHQHSPTIPNTDSRSRSNSGAADAAPPVPPINPRRRREDSRPRAPYEHGGMAPPRPPYASHSTNGLSSADPSEDEGDNKQTQRRRLRKPPPEVQSPGSRPMAGMSRDNSPPFIAKGPPVSRSVETPTTGADSGMNLPGGMF
ncbi:hypothetical protein C7999DRAFT_18081 [Corynascus novoguineensis]|uniref:Uncharacterized protein n=1 Tax=Corynascus novoguineensis TaxID=1126955 RepID=A0AAN7HFP5_9PEZI|nr:hypothetical protein C7999DRAFT_18081 [Corynascus novoguineensis]